MSIEGMRSSIYPESKFYVRVVLENIFGLIGSDFSDEFSYELTSLEGTFTEGQEPKLTVPDGTTLKNATLSWQFNSAFLSNLTESEYTTVKISYSKAENDDDAKSFSLNLKGNGTYLMSYSEVLAFDNDDLGENYVFWFSLQSETRCSLQGHTFEFTDTLARKPVKPSIFKLEELTRSGRRGLSVSF